IGGIWALRGTPVLGTTFSLGLVATFLLYVQRFNQPIQQIAVLWTNIQNAIAGAERIFGLMDEPAEIRSKPGAKSLPAIQGRVEFKDVWAEYEKGQPVLRGINLTA